MNLRMLTLLTALIAFVLVTAQARPASHTSCLHGANETTFQAQRRAAAVAAARAINTAQAQLRARGSYYSHAELATAPEVADLLRTLYPNSETISSLSLAPGTDLLPGWTLRLDATADGYWFMIRDTADPCGFGYVSNDAGVIYTSQPVR